MTFLEAERQIQIEAQELGLRAAEGGRPLGLVEAQLAVAWFFPSDHDRIVAAMTKDQMTIPEYLAAWRDLIGRAREVLYQNRLEKKLREL